VVPVPALILGAALLALSGCRDSPREVVQAASEAAAQGDLVNVRAAFSVATHQRLGRVWKLSGTTESAGWDALSGRLTFADKPLEIIDESIHGQFARVDARAGAVQRDYYLRKEDGRWRLELGAGLRYRKAAAADATKSKGKKKEKAEAEAEQPEEG
jgi:hypothetical protein